MSANSRMVSALALRFLVGLSALIPAVANEPRAAVASARPFGGYAPGYLVASDVVRVDLTDRIVDYGRPVHPPSVPRIVTRTVTRTITNRTTIATLVTIINTLPYRNGRIIRGCYPSRRETATLVLTQASHPAIVVHAGWPCGGVLVPGRPPLLGTAQLWDVIHDRST